MSTSHTKLFVKKEDNAPAREWIYGFLLLGILVGLLGSLLIAWQYHIDTDPQLIGLHFLALNAGYVIGVASAQRLVLRFPIRFVALCACGIAFASLVALTFLIPPVSPLYRLFGLGFMGWAGGALATALFYVLDPYFAESPAAVANRGGLLFGCGCLIATLMVGITYFARSVQIETALLAIVPLLFFVFYSRNRFPTALAPVPPIAEKNVMRHKLRSVRRVAAVLFSLLLFFQFGNEWALAGWLPLFLIHRLGANPVWAIFALAVYFLSLMFGRLAAKTLLIRVSHRKLLLASIVVAMFGYVLLSLSPTMAGAWAGVILIGTGFAPIYPLILETLGRRFSYHPGFYNGTFSIAITGGMLAPWLLGYVDAYMGIRYVMLLPACGSIIVLVLALLIMLEAHVMDGSKSGSEHRPVAWAGRS